MKPILTLVTGGSRGIGYAIARQMAAKGSDLLLVSLQDAKLNIAKKALRKEFKTSVATYVCDLAMEQQVDILAKHCVDHSLIPDFLVLDAGVFIEGGLVHSKPEDYRKTLDVNLHSIYYLVRHLAPRMKTKKKPRIVIIGSTAAYEAYPVGALYGVSKWALRGYAINLRNELMEQGIGVTFVAPGGTLTDLWAGEKLPPKRLLDPSDVGILVAALSDLSAQAVVEEIVVRPMLGDMHD